MTASIQQLSRRERSRLITLSVLRTSLSVALLLVIYAVFPIEPLASTETVTRLLIALGILALVIALQLQAIMTATYPQLRAIEAVVVAITVFIVLFALLYVGLARRTRRTSPGHSIGSVRSILPLRFCPQSALGTSPRTRTLHD